MAGKRILILTNRVPHPLNDGGNLAMHAMIDGYHKAGWEVCLLSMNTSRHPVSPDEERGIYTDLSIFETVKVDNRVKTLPTIGNFLFSNKPNHVMRFASEDFAARLQSRVDAFRPDVIQVESVYLTDYLEQVKGIGNIKLVLRLHNIEYQIWERLAAENKSFLKHFYFKNLAERIEKYEEWAWKQYNLLLTITDIDAAIVKASYPAAPIYTVPFGIDTDKVQQDGSDDLTKGYHIGAMDWLPNKEAIDWFLRDIWPAVHTAVPAFKFFFAGRYMPESYKNLQQEGVTSMGEVADANAFIADKKILIVPLRSGGGIRVKILEAMAAGKIVISTDVGMQGISAEPGVHYLRANNAKTFAEAVKWCFDNKEEALKMGAAAAGLIREQYAIATIMAGLSDKLKKMLA